MVLLVVLIVGFALSINADDDCSWALACGGDFNVNASNNGSGCLDPSLGDVAACQTCNFIYNSPPCDNTIENIYNNRVSLFGDSPHFNDICGGSAGGVDPNGNGDDWNDPNIECGPICALSGRPPFQSISLLETCYRYYERTCCYVIQDTEIDDAYFSLLEAGDRCNDELLYPKLKLRDAFCLGCDPNQGRYLIEGVVNV